MCREIGCYLLPKGRHPDIKDDLSVATPPTQLWLAESQGKVFQRKGPASQGRAGTTFRVSACLRSKVRQLSTGNHKRFYEMVLCPSVAPLISGGIYKH